MAVNTMAQTCYGLGLVFNMLWATAMIKLTSFLPLARRKHEEVSLFLLQMSWRLSFFFAPWMIFEPSDDYLDQWNLIRTLMAESDAECREKGVKPRPLFILGNHTSFLDTVLAVCKFPTQVLIRCRTYMDHHLFKLPVLSTVCKAVGHFPVYFNSTAEGAFKVDTAKMEAVEKRVDEHLNTGGWLCFFPEGAMNKDPDNVLPFRYGGMKRALEYDAVLVMFVAHNNPGVWPKKAKVGGFPGKVHYSLRPISPHTAKSFVAMARAEGAKEEKEMSDHELLARRLHEIMQTEYNTLAKRAEKEGGGKKALPGKKED